MKTLSLIIAVFALTGCSLLEKQVTQSASAVADGVDEYCGNFNQQQRAEFREQVNAKTDKGDVVVTCNGDE